MDSKEYTKEDAELLLKRIEKAYGFVPVVNQVLSERPDMFLPSAEASKSILERGTMDRKTKILCAVSAAAALCGEYCLEVQIEHAKDAGATRDEVLEAIMVGCQMNFTRSQSYALRRFATAYGIETRELGNRTEDSEK